MSNKILDAEVSFCSITKPDGHKNNKHLLGVYVDKAFKKKFEKDFNKCWDENKTAKAKKPAYAFKDWFSKDDGEHDKKNKGRLVFWLNANAHSEYGITLKQCDDCDFDEKDFGVIGTNSVIDVEYDLYYHNHADYGEMVLRSIKAVLLKKLVRYEGGDDLDGKAIQKKDKAKKEDKKKDKKSDKKDKSKKSDKKDKSKKKKNK